MRGLLFSQMEPPAGWEDDFHSWYEDEHIPARMGIDGFESAVRYEVLDGEPRYLACYFLDDMAALSTPEYQRLKSDPGERTARMLDNVLGFTRYICDEISDTGAADTEGALLFAVGFTVPDEAQERFEDWYEGEHVGLLMKVPGWLRVRRFKVRPGSAGTPWTHLALHEIRDAATLEHPARSAARDTAKRDALAAEPWFSGSGRWLYRPISVAHATQTKGT